MRERALLWRARTASPASGHGFPPARSGGRMCPRRTCCKSRHVPAAGRRILPHLPQREPATAEWRGAKGLRSAKAVPRMELCPPAAPARQEEVRGFAAYFDLQDGEGDRGVK